MSNRSYNSGDIVSAVFQFAGKNTRKLRAAVIISALEQSSYLVMYVTSRNISESSWDVLIKADNTNNLHVDSFIQTNRVLVIDQDILMEKIGVLSQSDKKRIAKKIEKIANDFIK